MERDLNWKDICDFLAYKAAKALGWDTTKYIWHLGCRSNGYQLYSIAVFSFGSKRFENLKGKCGIDILLPRRTQDPAKILASLLTSAAVEPIVVYKSGKPAGEVLPRNPALEPLLLEMDLEGWKRSR